MGQQSSVGKSSEEQISGVHEDVSATGGPELLTLPLELLALIAASLPLHSLASLAATCSFTHRRLPDELWLRPLTALRANCEASVTATPTRRTASIAAARAELAMRAAAEQAALAEFSTALAGIGAEGASARLQLQRLRSLVCSLCVAAPAGAMYFPVTERGVCHGCASRRPAEADEWRHQQSIRERLEHTRRDSRVSVTLVQSLAGALPLRLRDAIPRLLFSSDRMGGSISVMLQPKRGALGRRGFPGGAGTSTPLDVLFFGSRQAFLFSLGGGVPPGRSNDDTPRATGCARRAGPEAGADTHPPQGAARVFPSTGRDSNFVSASSEAGLQAGGDSVLPGLWIAPDFSSGRCLPSHTYGDTSTLASSKDFEIGCVQLWGLATAEEEEEEEMRRGGGAGVGSRPVGSTAAGSSRPGPVGSGSTGAPQTQSVMQARRADAMLLPFVGIEKQVAGMRV